MTVGEMIDFLAQFDREAVVLINGDSGTPDPVEMSGMYTEWDEVEFEDGTSEGMRQLELAWLDEGSYAIKTRQPLFWPS